MAEKWKGRRGGTKRERGMDVSNIMMLGEKRGQMMRSHPMLEEISIMFYMTH